MGSIGSGKFWFRDLDSNQDTQLQRLMSYQLDDPGIVANTALRIMPQRSHVGPLGPTQHF